MRRRREQGPSQPTRSQLLLLLGRDDQTRTRGRRDWTLCRSGRAREVAAPRAGGKCARVPLLSRRRRGPARSESARASWHPSLGHSAGRVPVGGCRLACLADESPGGVGDGRRLPRGSGRERADPVPGEGGRGRKRPAVDSACACVRRGAVEARQAERTGTGAWGASETGVGRPTHPPAQRLGSGGGKGVAGT